MHRRTFLATGLAAFAALRSNPAFSRSIPQGSASGGLTAPSAVAELVRQRAEELSRRDYVVPADTLPASMGAMGYDEYRDLRFRPERAVWRGEGLGFEIQFFVAAYLFRAPVDIFLVENGAIRPLSADRELFDFGPQEDKVPAAARLAFSGFRIHAPLNRSDYYDELLAFQGASYFRGLGRDHSYGLSARALSLNTEGPEVEEFPAFTSFWIERPADARSITLHALLDSPSVTGAYTFRIAPGAQTAMDIDAVLFPRRDLTKVGFAPLTSMYLKDTHDGSEHPDFRPAIHDSDGLASWNGRDERLWRPLLNPPEVQVSSFADKDPKGFGLIQRARKFVEYEDLEARYHDRPSAWVEPTRGWGEGAVQLIEIPTQVEYFDNIVAAWRPKDALPAGRAYDLAYRLTWCNDTPAASGYRIGKTRIGEGSRPGTVHFVVDFLDSGAAKLEKVASAGVTDVPLRPLSEAVVDSSVGITGAPLLQRNPQTGGIRATFEFDPQDHSESELRLSLLANGEPASEVWLFRWRR